MIALAYNLPGLTGELRLPRSVYADIFAGKIHNWNHPRIAAANPRLALPATATSGSSATPLDEDRASKRRR